MPKLTHIFLLLALLAPGLLRAQDADLHATWVADFDKAVDLAKKQQKDLLVDFTGSDWCGWCMRLHKEVFSHESFLKDAQQHFVLVALDFPRTPPVIAKVPNPKRNAELQQKYGITGFPTVLLMTPEGQVYGRTGYREGGPEKYVAHLTDLRTNGRKHLFQAIKIAQAFQNAQGEARKPLLQEAVKLLASMQAKSPGVGELAPVVKQALAGNDAALKESAITALLKAGQADGSVQAAARKLDPQGKKGLLELAVLAEIQQVKSRDQLDTVVKSIDAFAALKTFKDRTVAAQIYANGAWFNFRFLKKAEAAKTYALLLKKTDGKNPRWKQLLTQILK